MDFVSFDFYFFLSIVLVLYYAFPLQKRWGVLLIGSLTYFYLVTRSIPAAAVFIGMITLSYALGLANEAYRAKYVKSNIGDTSSTSQSGATQAGLTARRLLLTVSIILVLLPLCVVKYSPALYCVEELFSLKHGLIIPVGLSFFTMQIIAYLIDIYKGKISAQHNLLKYMLFVSFFPQILQGPIPRYEQLEPQLVSGHKFDETGFAKGFMLIMWGFFLKLMIADKAKIVVDTIFASPDTYRGAFVLVGGALYSVQLYTDFLACVTLAQGMSQMLGIHLAENFRHPYFARSISDFWGRWHLSLSFWLRDYVYIGLGGSRKGKLRKYLNIVVTFFVSGLWHGNGLRFIVWGMMHAFYQIFGAITKNARDRAVEAIGIPKDSSTRAFLSIICTFLLVTLTRIIYRAPSLSIGLFMVKSMFTTYNPWIFFDDSLLRLGLVWKEWAVLIISIAVHIRVSLWQESFCIRDAILELPFCARCAIYALAFTAIMALGTYGYGFNAADFIYRGY